MPTRFSPTRTTRAILLEHALRLGRGGRRLTESSEDQVDLLAHDVRRLVDLFGGSFTPKLGIAADRARKPVSGVRCPNL